jgi:hypothetical protein
MFPCNLWKEDEIYIARYTVFAEYLPVILQSSHYLQLSNMTLPYALARVGTTI